MLQLIAKNDLLESKPSEVVALKIDPVAFIEPVRNLVVDSRTEYTVSLSWKSTPDVEGYQVLPQTSPGEPYPKLPARNTTINKITGLLQFFNYI